MCMIVSRVLLKRFLVLMQVSRHSPLFPKKIATPLEEQALQLMTVHEICLVLQEKEISGKRSVLYRATLKQERPVNGNGGKLPTSLMRVSQLNLLLILFHHRFRLVILNRLRDGLLHMLASESA